MATSKLTSKVETTIPKEARDVGDKLTERPAFYYWEGIIKNSSGDIVKEMKEARKRRGRV